MPAPDAVEPVGPDVRICDVTIREGDQRIDGAFTREAKLAVARTMAELGVASVQIDSGAEDLALVPALAAALAELALPCALEAACFGMGRRWRELLDRVALSGCQAVQIVIRAGRAQLHGMGLSETEAVERAGMAVRHAADQGLRTCLGISFAPQADESLVADLCAAASEAGAWSAALADSLGTAGPADVRRMVRAALRRSALPVSVHCHDDLGLAVANSLAGVEAGARGVEASVLGLGERSGNAALEIVAVALHVLLGARTGIRLEHLYRCARQVAALANVEVPAGHAVIGRHAFATKLDVHEQLAQRAAGSLNPYDPELVGNKRRTLAGKGSGPLVLRAALGRIGVELDTEKLPALAERVSQHAERQGRAVSDADLRELAASLEEEGEETR